MTCLILSTAVQCRQSKARKTLPVPVGERHRQGLGSVSDHRTYHTPFRTTRKQHGQRGLKMKWSGAETAKNNRKHSEKVPGACSHRRGRGFDPLRVHQRKRHDFCRVFFFGSNRFVSMLDGNQFRLRQGFCARQNTCTVHKRWSTVWGSKILLASILSG